MPVNMDIHSILPMHLFALIVVSVFAYVIGSVVYQLHFSPLSRFPGPKIAAVTYLYEFYYDAILKGRYIFKIKELHEKYGTFIEKEYTQSGKTAKREMLNGSFILRAYNSHQPSRTSYQ